ncbi:polyketide synthase dehydratase domain-containing protein [Streptomyces griseorubiginosus]
MGDGQPSTDDADFAVWPPVGAQPVSVAGLYDGLAAQGYDYGPAFRGVRTTPACPPATTRCSPKSDSPMSWCACAPVRPPPSPCSTQRCTRSRGPGCCRRPTASACRFAWSGARVLTRPARARCGSDCVVRVRMPCR